MATPVEIAVKATGTSSTAAALDKIEGRASSLGRNLKRLAVGGALVAGAALVKLGADSVQAASKSQQSLGATETVFGKYAKTVVRESKRAANSVGLSANEYRELANVVGASLAGAGVPIRKATDLTAKLNTRAADLAATFGGSTKEAIEAVSSLLRGEADPIERYGISIKQSDVNARLAAKGLDKLTGAGLKQAEMQARLDLLFEKSSKSAGAFARESGTLEGAQQRLSAKIENVQAKFGNLLLPALTAGVNLISRKVIPAAEDLADWLERNQDEIEGAGTAVKDSLLPPLEALARIVSAAVQFLAGLPPEVQKLAVTAGVAALVVPKLNAALAAAKTTAGGYVGSIRNAETRTAAMGTAARNAAGILGVLALVDSAKRSGTALGTLEKAAGGALLGFQVGGPIGAAIGTGAGLLYGLQDAANASREAFRQSITINEDYAASFDQVTGAITKATKQAVFRNLQSSDQLTVSRLIGIPDREMVAAATGDVEALERITARVRRLTGTKQQLAGPDSDLFFFNRASAANFITGLKYGEKQLTAEQRAFIRALEASKTYGQALKGLPPKVKTEVKALGLAPSMAQIRALKREYDLTPKQVRTIVKAIGVEKAQNDAKSTRRTLDDVGKSRPSLAPWLKGLDAALAGGKRTTDRGVGDVNRLLFAGTSKARPNLSPFQTALRQALDNAKSTAGTGGSQIGAAAKTGLTSGFAGAIVNFSNAVTAAVDAAIEAGRRAARSHSPSRRTQELGRDIARGLERGMRDGETANRKQGKRLVDQVLKAAESSARDLASAVERILKSHDLEGRALRRAVKSLEDESRALNRNAASQDRVNKKLAAARSALADLTQQSKDYGRSIRDAVVESGNITTLGKDDAGTATTSGILDQLRTRLQAAERFASLIATLTNANLNETTLRQLLAAGVEGGLSTAEALAAGGQAAISEVNSLTQQLTQAGVGLGTSAAETMYGAGIQAAQGLVDGLESQAAKLDRIADRLAARLVRGIRRALKINSPSEVFRDLGRLTVKGLELGLDDTHVSRVGANLAASLVDGFADPKLTARALLDSAAGGIAPTVFELRLTAEQANDLQQGGTITGKVDLYSSAGGRRVAKVVTR